MSARRRYRPQPESLSEYRGQGHRIWLNEQTGEIVEVPNVRGAFRPGRLLPLILSEGFRRVSVRQLDRYHRRTRGGAS